jgi:predicted RNase H-like HicB family nuclease
MGKIKTKQNTICDVAGIKYQCCNDFKNKAKLNQEEQLLDKANLNLLINKYTSLKYPIKIEKIIDSDSTYIFAYLPDFGSSACSATGETEEEALIELEDVKLDVIIYMILAGKKIPMPNTSKNLRGIGRTTKMLKKALAILETDEVTESMPILVLGATQRHTLILRDMFCEIANKKHTSIDKLIYFRTALPDKKFTVGKYFREIFIDHFVYELESNRKRD